MQNILRSSGELKFYSVENLVISLWWLINLTHLVTFEEKELYFCIVEKIATIVFKRRIAK